MRKLGIGTIARAIGFAAMGAVIAATSVHLRPKRGNPAERLAAAPATPRQSLARELLRCRAIGMRAKGDAACAAAWAENRRRFFAPLSKHPPAGKPDADKRRSEAR
jgi:conjugative transfer region protein TrbK